MSAEVMNILFEHGLGIVGVIGVSIALASIYTNIGFD